jgi:hypothetical protein
MFMLSGFRRETSLLTHTVDSVGMFWTSRILGLSTWDIAITNATIEEAPFQYDGLPTRSLSQLPVLLLIRVICHPRKLLELRDPKKFLYLHTCAAECSVDGRPVISIVGQLLLFLLPVWKSASNFDDAGLTCIWMAV